MWITENIHIVITIWALINLLAYIIIGGLIIYVWERKNKKNVIKHMNDEDKEYLMRYFGVKKEEDLELPPSLPISLFLGGSGRATRIVENQLINGPHIPSAYCGVIDKSELFEFGMYVADPNRCNRMTVGRGQRYYKYMLFCGFVILIGFAALWALIPYINAATRHFEAINRYVYNFSEHDKIKLTRQGREGVIATIEALQKDIAIK